MVECVCSITSLPVRARQESAAPRHARCLPHLGVRERAHEHLVQAQRVRAIILHYVVRVDHVPATLAHLVALTHNPHSRVSENKD